jgi:hypothetical protein
VTRMRKLPIAAVFVAFHLAASSPMSASAQDTVLSLLSYCTSSDADLQVRCAAYISGANDMLQLLSSGARSKLVCTPPAGLQVHEIRDLLIAWIKRDPDNRANETARLAIFGAIQDAYPCPRRAQKPERRTPQ